MVNSKSNALASKRARRLIAALVVTFLVSATSAGFGIHSVIARSPAIGFTIGRSAIVPSSMHIPGGTTVAHCALGIPGVPKSPAP